MSEVGLTPKQYLLQMFDDEEKRFREITRLDDVELEEYNGLLTHLVLVNQNRTSYDTNQKGKALENIVSFLLEHSSVFEIFRNIRNSTNEVDQILILNSKGLKFQKEGLINLNGDHFLSECKNYDKKIDVTWVGKFFSLLQTNQSKIGLIFSYHGLAGRNEWDSSIGLVKKLFLLKEKLEDRTYIVDFSISDFQLIAQGTSMLELIHSKLMGLKLQTNFSGFITKHPAETEGNS